MPALLRAQSLNLLADFTFAPTPGVFKRTLLFYVAIVGENE